MSVDRCARAASLASCLVLVCGSALGSGGAAGGSVGTPDWAELISGGEASSSAMDLFDAPSPRASVYRDLGPMSACFDPDNPPSEEVRKQVEKAMIDAWQSQDDFDSRYNTGTRWSGGSFGSQGDPITLTWSLVPDGVSISGGVGEGTSPCNLFAKMDAAVARATWVAKFQASFDRWAAISGLSYQRITKNGNDWDDGAAWGSAYSAGNRGHVRIAMHLIDGASGILAYNSFPQNGDMVLDSGDVGNFDSTGSDYRFLRNTVMHEHGHGMGLYHTCSSNSSILMEPFLSTSFDGPQQDDIRGSHRHYGDINEPDNTVALAVNAGVLGVGSVTLGNVPTPSVTNASVLSIDANAEQDYHKFTTNTPLLGNFTLQPIGSTYDDSDQASNGSCENDPDTNAKAVANLALQFLASNGTTVISEASAAASGVDELLSNVLISPPGTLYLRVYESDAPTQAQLYKLVLQGTSIPTMAASDGTFTDKVAITWTNITGNSGYQVLRNTSNNKGTATIVGTPGTNSFDDTTATPGQVYFYWINAQQGGGGFRDVAGPEQGSRQDIPCPPDFNGDGFLNGDDFDAYVAAFENGELSADYNGDGFTNGDDFDLYVADFDLGC